MDGQVVQEKTEYDHKLNKTNRYTQMLPKGPLCVYQKTLMK